MGDAPGGAFADIQDIVLVSSRSRMWWKRVLVHPAFDPYATPPDPFFFLIDLRTKKTAQINSDPEFVGFSSAPVLPLSSDTLLGLAFDTTAPFDHQFFVAGDAESLAARFPPVLDTTTLAGIPKQNRLRAAAKLKKAKSGIEPRIVTESPGDVHVLSSKKALGSFAKPGPL